LQTLAALEAVLRRAGHSQTANAGIDTAMTIYTQEGY
jgi:(S)-ureidoglycine-glyoxylate aminotransferase